VPERGRELVPGVPAGALGEAGVSEPTPLRLAVDRADEAQRKDCIALLEEALAEAKKGRGFDAVFILATYPDSTTVHRMQTCGFSSIQVAGVLEYIKHGVLAHMYESPASLPPRPELPPDGT
jgi:hypothetical protein